MGYPENSRASRAHSLLELENCFFRTLLLTSINSSQILSLLHPTQESDSKEKVSNWSRRWWGNFQKQLVFR